MRNAYFQLVNIETGYGLKLVPAQEGGESYRLQEILSYLEARKLAADINLLKRAAASGKEELIPMGEGPCPKVEESYLLTIAEDGMSATARFYPPSETCGRMSIKEFVNDLQYRNVLFGVQADVLERHFNSAGMFCTNLVIAKGQAPRHGTDARIEYYFNTELHAQPEQNEDGTVDYHNLNLLNRCIQGDLLAKIIPADPGDYGTNVMGKKIKPRDVKRVSLSFGNNVILSQDRMSITAGVTGHVMLLNDKVFVSNVYEVTNVDNSTGNILYDGSVRVSGNVNSGFEVRATGNVEVGGVVEGAYIEAGGDIIIASGMKGMGKGTLKAGNNITCKFLENCNAFAEGFVNTESILHSNVSAGIEITVTGKKGFITGGHVQAKEKVTVRTLGATMGAATVVEVGVSPALKARYLTLQKEIAEIVKIIKNAQPVIVNFTQKKAAGARFSEDQIKYVKQTAALLEAKKVELQQKSEEMKTIGETFAKNDNATVIVSDEVFPGTTIVIGDVSMNVQKELFRSKFVKSEGQVVSRMI